MKVKIQTILPEVLLGNPLDMSVEDRLRHHDGIPLLLWMIGFLHTTLLEDMMKLHQDTKEGIVPRPTERLESTVMIDILEERELPLEPEVQKHSNKEFHQLISSLQRQMIIQPYRRVTTAMMNMYNPIQPLRRYEVLKILKLVIIKCQVTPY